MGRWLLIGILCSIVWSVLSCLGIVHAQSYSQEFINGRVEGQLAALKEQVEEMRKLLWTMVAAGCSSLVVQIMGLRNASKERANAQREPSMRSRRDDYDD